MLAEHLNYAGLLLAVYAGGTLLVFLDLCKRLLFNIGA